MCYTFYIHIKTGISLTIKKKIRHEEGWSLTEVLKRHLSVYDNWFKPDINPDDRDNMNRFYLRLGNNNFIYDKSDTSCSLLCRSLFHAKPSATAFFFLKTEGSPPLNGII